MDQGIFQARILEWVAISSSNVYVFLCYVFTWLRQILVRTCGIFDLSRGLRNVVPWSGIKPRPLHWEHVVLATGPPGKSLVCICWPQTLKVSLRKSHLCWSCVIRRQACAQVYGGVLQGKEWEGSEMMQRGHTTQGLLLRWGHWQVSSQGWRHLPGVGRDGSGAMWTWVVGSLRLAALMTRAQAQPHPANGSTS